MLQQLWPAPSGEAYLHAGILLLPRGHRVEDLGLQLHILEQMHNKVLRV
jgi:hypothetical protein